MLPAVGWPSPEYGTIFACMTIPKVKATYSLDAETTALIERLARRWAVSKSEALPMMMETMLMSCPLNVHSWAMKALLLTPSLPLLCNAR